MEIKIQMPDEIGEENIKKLIEGLNKQVENIKTQELINKPIKEFLKVKYPTSFKTAYWMNYDDNIDFVSYLIVEFNHNGKNNAKDLFDRIISHEMFDENVKLKHNIYDCNDYFEIKTDGIRDIDGLKNIFRKSLDK